MRGSQPMAPDSEQILDHAVGRGEALQMGSRFEAAHLALPLPGRLMRYLGPVVRILIGAVNDGRHETALFLQQLAKESHRGEPIPSRLDQDVEHVAVFFEGSPQVLLATIDRHEPLIEMPGVAELTAPNAGVVWRRAPLADRLVPKLRAMDRNTPI